MDNTRAAVGVSIVVAVVGLFPMPARGQAGKPFVLPSSCTVPFADIETLRSIDKNCGIFGDSPTTSPEHQEQNRRKNNLCATTSPSDITVADLVSLGAPKRNPERKCLARSLTGLWLGSRGTEGPTF